MWWAFFGHSISLITAVGVLGAIDTAKYEVVPVGITKDAHHTIEPR